MESPVEPDRDLGELSDASGPDPESPSPVNTPSKEPTRGRSSTRLHSWGSRRWRLHMAKNRERQANYQVHWIAQLAQVRRNETEKFDWVGRNSSLSQLMPNFFHDFLVDISHNRFNRSKTLTQPIFTVSYLLIAPLEAQTPVFIQKQLKFPHTVRISLKVSNQSYDPSVCRNPWTKSRICHRWRSTLFQKPNTSRRGKDLLPRVQSTCQVSNHRQM